MPKCQNSSEFTNNLQTIYKYFTNILQRIYKQFTVIKHKFYMTNLARGNVKESLKTRFVVNDST
jgi:hypothetical protein